MSEPSILSSNSSQAVNSPLSKSRRLLIVGAVIVALVAVGAVVKTSGGVGGSRSGTIASNLGENSRLSAGNEHVCTIRADSTVWCWGEGYYGELGVEETYRLPPQLLTSTPVQVATSDVSDARSLAAGLNHTCALLNDGRVKCWGRNDSGQTNSYPGDSWAPTFVKVPSGTAAPDVPLENVKAIAAGYNHTCALKNDGGVSCWGKNNKGQLGRGYTDPSNTVSRVWSGSSFDSPPLKNVVAISAAGDHTCALLSDTSVKCWGDGGYGALGNGESKDSSLPVSVHKSLTDERNLVDVASLAVGPVHTCILNTSGKASCWGSNVWGQLGNNPLAGTTAFSLKKAPVEVDSDDEFSNIATSSFTTCAILKSTKAVQCWGLNYSGQVGDGTVINRQQPVNVEGDGNYNVELALGKAFSCSLASTQAIRCWGDNSEGQLGNGTTNYSTTNYRNTAG
ncbi:MAG: hypothetical protein JHC66_06325, partial [Acidimicrobiia bacterium]|nr:hypothetical protein [Acidimicrobiia bacterium]